MALYEYVPVCAGALDSQLFPVNAMQFVERSHNGSSVSHMTFFRSWEETLSDPGGGSPARVGVAPVWPSFLGTLGISPVIAHLGWPGGVEDAPPVNGLGYGVEG